MARRGAFPFIVAAVVSALPVIAPAADAPADRGLTIAAGEAGMQTGLAPVPLSQIVVRPGSDGQEAFAVGHAYGSVASGIMFLRWTATGGWEPEGNAIDELTGLPALLNPSALDVTESGVAWVSPFAGGFVRREPDGRWIASRPLSGTPTLNGIDIDEDASGVFGAAAGDRGALWVLNDGVWRSESLLATGANTGVLPNFSDVVVVDRTRAYAVGSTSSPGSPPRLTIYQRTAATPTTPGTWAPVPTGQPMLDQPPAPTQGASDVGTVNRSAQGTAIDLADDGMIWISGVIQPVDPQRVVGGGVNRPFVLRYDGSSFTSFCPAQYTVSQSGARTVPICDEQLPFTVGILTDIDAAGGDVFAGGTGLLRYHGGAWSRVPSGVGTIQRLSFADADEGWITSKPQVSLFRGLLANTQVVGHLTRDPIPSALQRWPHAGDEPLVAVAMHPSDDSQAIAVGERGAIWRADLDLGVERMASPVTTDLTSIAWARADLAFAVGAGGTVLRFTGSTWMVDASAHGLTDALLDEVAIAPDGSHAIAVGDGGTLLRWDGSTWSRSTSPTTKRLFAVAILDDGTEIIAGRGPETLYQRTRGRGEWLPMTIAETLRSEESNFTVIEALPGGRALIAGNAGLMYIRERDGSLATNGVDPLSASVHAIAARNGSVVAVPGIREDGSRIDDRGRVGDIWGSLMEGPKGWIDRSNWTLRSLQSDVDAPAVHDPVLAVALDSTGRHGWAVGGFPGDTETFDGHRRGEQPTSSIWRVDLDHPPASSPASYATTPPTRDGVSFAFLSDTACWAPVCGTGLGLGTRGDRIMLAALREIRDAARRGDISFLGIGGDLRSSGIPDDLAAVEALFDELPIPTYAAIGDQDLRPGVGSNSIAPTIDNPLVPDEVAGSDPTASNALYREVFADRPAPWGTAAAPDGIRPVSVAGAVPAADGARTHYVFDVTDRDGQRLRVAVVDTSANLALDLTTQNPSEKQDAWLNTVLTAARVEQVPVVVLTHDPALVPHSSRTDAAALTTAVSAGASAVVAGGDRANIIGAAGGDVADVAVPFGAFGTGGAPLDAQYRPERGAYDAWVRVTVNPKETDVLGRVRVDFDVYPILESLTLDVPVGRVVRAGDPVEVNAIGRLFEVGGANAQFDGDGNEGNATYVRMPFPDACAGLAPTSSERCTPTDVARPDLRFATNDPSIAMFVRRDPADRTLPAGGPAGLIPDPTSGLLCTFKPGDIVVTVESGVHGARIPMHVTGGNGACIEQEVFERIPPSPIAKPPKVQPQPPAPAINPPPPINARVPEVAAAAAIAPPPINPAPAPPAGGAGGRQEEHEAASERANFVARRTESGVPGPSALMLLLLPTLAYVAARIVHDRYATKPTPAYRRFRH